MYSIAVQLTGSQEFTETVEDILEYVSRDLTHPEGGFYTAEVSKHFCNCSVNKLIRNVKIWLRNQ